MRFVKLLAMIILATVSVHAQGNGGKSGFGGKAGFGGSLGTVAPVVESAGATNAFSTTATFTFSPHAIGDIIAVWGSTTNASGLSATTGTGGCPATFTTVTSQTNTPNQWSQIWSVGTATSTASCTITVNSTGSTSYVNLAMWDIANASTTADGSPSPTTSFAYQASTGTSYNSPAVTTTMNNDIVLVATTTESGNNTQTPVSPFTADANSGSGAGGWAGNAHDVLATAGAITPSWTTVTNQTIITGTLALEP